MRNKTLKIVAAVFVLAFVVVATGPAFAAGANVKAIQSALNKHGYHVKVDGKMGPHTESALMKFQQANGLSATGKPDASTAAKLGVK